MFEQDKGNFVVYYGIRVCSEQDAMESFFREHQLVESIMWRGLVAILVGLGSMLFLHRSRDKPTP